MTLVGMLEGYFVRVLHDGDAAALFDRAHAHGAVVAGSGEHYTDHARPTPARCRTKQRID